MCNACGFICCASDMFDHCGCDGCECEECWSEDEGDGDEFCCQPIVNVGDELHQILGDALKAAETKR